MIDINPQNKDTWRNYLNMLQADSTSSDEEYAHVIRQYSICISLMTSNGAGG